METQITAAELELQSEEASLGQAEYYAERFGIPLHPRPKELTLDKIRELTRQYWSEIHLLTQ